VATRICVAVREATNEGTVLAARRAAQWADIVEIRADFIRDLDVPRLLGSKSCPILFTLRSRQEGGAYTGTERDRLATLLEAAACGADWVDVEFSADWQTVLNAVEHDRVILSYHNFEETPDSLVSRVDEMARAGAGILKVATKANRLSDNLTISSALAHAAAHNIDLCALAMGPGGLPSRVLAAVWGSWMTFASLPGGEATADGQVPADEMERLYRVRELNPGTRVYGVLGRPLAHSLSPRLHNSVFAECRRDAVYIPLEAQGVDDFVRFCRVVQIDGVSVTIPFKESVRACTSSLSEEADQTGAVNTLLRRNGAWHGENTDIAGFLKPLRRRADPARLRAVVLGAGGAARAVVYGLISQGADVCVFARDPAKAQTLAGRFGATHADWGLLRTARWDLLVNATPVGTYPDVDESPIPGDWLTGEWVYDLVYNPKETRLLKEASRRGCKVIHGSEMLLAQAVEQQLHWFGVPPPEEVMQAVLDEALSAQQCNAQGGRRLPAHACGTGPDSGTRT
jgi:3-dehydroquinate dehydratase/shikimate dehydrogenase